MSNDLIPDLFRRGVRRILCTAFAASALFPVSACRSADTSNAFGVNAAKNLSSYYFQASRLWAEMLGRQNALLKDPAKVARYQEYLSSFDKLKGKPLIQMANEVNAIVKGQLRYIPDIDPRQYQQGDYWASSIETVLSGVADCEDYAVLQYDILHHLGVPEEKIYVATVNGNGVDAGVTHAVLLLNVAGKWHKPDFIVLDYNRPVGRASESPFLFYEVMNEKTFESLSTSNTLGPMEPHAGAPQRMKVKVRPVGI